MLVTLASSNYYYQPTDSVCCRITCDIGLMALKHSFLCFTIDLLQLFISHSQQLIHYLMHVLTQSRSLPLEMVVLVRRHGTPEKATNESSS